MRRGKRMKKTMLACVFEGNGRYALKKVPIPSIEKPDQVLLKVLVASICGTDIQILKVPSGHPANSGIILCHEFIGEVVEVGKECSGFKPGDWVAVDPNITCGCCGYCQAGKHNMCENMTTLGIFLNGGFAEYNVAPGSQLYKLSKSLKPELAVFIEPLSCVLNAFRKVRPNPGDKVLVLGAGPIGQYFILLSRVSGAGKIYVSEPMAFRRMLAKKSGADRVIDPSKEDLEKVILSETGEGVDVVYDAVGSLADIAIKLSVRGGRILLFGQNQQAKTRIKQNDITRRELSIVGSYIALHTFPEAIKILETGRLKLDHFITHRIRLKELNKGFSAMRTGKAIKVIVFP